MGNESRGGRGGGYQGRGQGKPRGGGSGANSDRTDRRGDGAGTHSTPIKRSLRGGAPPPRNRKKTGSTHVRKPDLPDDPPSISKGVRREIKRTARPQDVDDVAAAVAVATEAVETGDLPRAIELLEWAKTRASRAIAVREGLGVALYLSGDWSGTQRELAAYRRLSGRQDQNHLLADAARALGHGERVRPLVDELQAAVEAGDAPLDRLVEAMIVLAGLQADRGELAAALRTLEQVPLPAESVAEMHARTWYFAGEIAERMGDRDTAREYFEAVLAVDEEFLDTAERLDALS